MDNLEQGNFSGGVFGRRGMHRASERKPAGLMRCENGIIHYDNTITNRPLTKQGPINVPDRVSPTLCRLPFKIGNKNYILLYTPWHHVSFQRIRGRVDANTLNVPYFLFSSFEFNNSPESNLNSYWFRRAYSYGVPTQFDGDISDVDGNGRPILTAPLDWLVPSNRGTFGLNVFSIYDEDGELYMVDRLHDFAGPAQSSDVPVDPLNPHREVVGAVHYEYSRNNRIIVGAGNIPDNAHFLGIGNSLLNAYTQDRSILERYLDPQHYNVEYQVMPYVDGAILYDTKGNVSPIYLTEHGPIYLGLHNHMYAPFTVQVHYNSDTDLLTDPQSQFRYPSPVIRMTGESDAAFNQRVAVYNRTVSSVETTGNGYLGSPDSVSYLQAQPEVVRNETLRGSVEDPGARTSRNPVILGADSLTDPEAVQPYYVEGEEIVTTTFFNFNANFYPRIWVYSWENSPDDSGFTIYPELTDRNIARYSSRDTSTVGALNSLQDLTHQTSPLTGPVFPQRFNLYQNRVLISRDDTLIGSKNLAANQSDTAFGLPSRRIPLFNVNQDTPESTDAFRTTLPSVNGIPSTILWTAPYESNLIFGTPNNLRFFSDNDVLTNTSSPNVFTHIETADVTPVRVRNFLFYVIENKQGISRFETNFNYQAQYISTLVTEDVRVDYLVGNDIISLIKDPEDTAFYAILSDGRVLYGYVYTNGHVGWSEFILPGFSSGAILYNSTLGVYYPHSETGELMFIKREGVVNEQDFYVEAELIPGAVYVTNDDSYLSQRGNAVRASIILDMTQGESVQIGVGGTITSIIEYNGGEITEECTEDGGLTGLTIRYEGQNPFSIIRVARMVDTYIEGG